MSQPFVRPFCGFCCLYYPCANRSKVSPFVTITFSRKKNRTVLIYVGFKGCEDVPCRRTHLRPFCARMKVPLKGGCQIVTCFSRSASFQFGSERMLELTTSSSSHFAFCQSQGVLNVALVHELPKYEIVLGPCKITYHRV